VWSLYPPSKGGIGFEPVDVGIAFAVAGGTLIWTQLVVFPFISRRFSLLTIFRVVTIIRIPLYPLFATLAMVADISKTYLWLCLVAIIITRETTLVTCFTVSALFINNCAPPGQVQGVNGLGQTFNSVFRAAGPISGLSLMAWSMSAGFETPPFNIYFVFIVFGILTFVEWVLMLFVEHSINVRQEIKEIFDHGPDPIHTEESAPKKIRGRSNSRNGAPLA
jgi:hypothetical protein